MANSTFDLSIHLGPGCANLKGDKTALSTDKDTIDGDSESGQLTSKPKSGYVSTN